MNLSSVNPYTAAAEKALAAQRSTGGRKKSVKSADATEGSATSEETLMISSWLTTNQRKVAKR
jgi:hypothetical protein